MVGWRNSYVAEDDPGERSTYFIVRPFPKGLSFPKSLTTTGIVDNLLYDAANVAIALSLCLLASVLIIFSVARCFAYVVESAELSRGLVQAGVGREDGAATFTLVPDDATHGEVFWFRGWGSMGDVVVELRRRNPFRRVG